jgi:sterol desaturase/sphingolipid hydroxylase (fatty acid hydroxylase superfamily)
VHYVAHIPFVPRTRFGRYVKKYHLWHHYKNETLWFGVTNPSMDFVGRTYRAVAEVERSASTRVLFPDQ